MIFFVHPIDRLIAQAFHRVVTRPWSKVTGKSHISLVMFLWYAGTASVGVALVTTLAAAGNGPLALFTCFSSGALAAIVIATQLVFLMEMRSFMAEVVRCVHAGEVSPLLVRIAMNQSRTRLYYLGLGVGFFLYSRVDQGLLDPWVPVCIFMALERYALTDLHFGSGKSVLAKAVETVRSMDLGVRVLPA